MNYFVYTLHQTISELPKGSLSKRGLVHNHSYENEFNLHVNEISFSYERMSTNTRFEKEAKGNSEMAYCFYVSWETVVAHHDNIPVRHIDVTRKSGEVRWRFGKNFTSCASWRHVSSGKEQVRQGHCYTSQLTFVFRLEEDTPRVVGQNSLG